MSNLVIRIFAKFCNFSIKIIDIFSEMHYSENTKFLTNFQFLEVRVWITLVEQKHYKYWQRQWINASTLNIEAGTVALALRT